MTVMERSAVAMVNVSVADVSVMTVTWEQYQVAIVSARTGLVYRLQLVSNVAFIISVFV